MSTIRDYLQIVINSAVYNTLKILTMMKLSHLMHSTRF